MSPLLPTFQLNDGLLTGRVSKSGCIVGFILLVTLDSAVCFLLKPLFTESIRFSELRGQSCSSASSCRRILRPGHKMSIFPSGSGFTGAFAKSPGEINVELPYQLDNSDPFVLDTMTIRVPTKIIGFRFGMHINI